jgi:hypothetical protein
VKNIEIDEESNFAMRITWVREITDIIGMGGNIRNEIDDL